MEILANCIGIGRNERLMQIQGSQEDFGTSLFPCSSRPRCRQFSRLLVSRPCLDVREAFLESVPILLYLRTETSDGYLPILALSGKGLEEPPRL
ncbi:hypothetical protein CBM2599_B50430 [Cupriavidus taiwanensis]|nr:hypothetical protein CBM2600_B10563 [Cupriavidus taiwanensis]SOY96498.1 hypothetical protein CBM2599_B50430 [Cupriavidus taiwanensis]